MSYVLEGDIGNLVTLKTDKEESERMITGISLRHGSISYELTLAANAPTWHYGL